MAAQQMINDAIVLIILVLPLARSARIARLIWSMKLFLIYQSDVIGATPNIKYKGSAVIAGSLGVPYQEVSSENSSDLSPGPALVFRFRS
jgi:hypothetical protein